MSGFETNIDDKITHIYQHVILNKHVVLNKVNKGALVILKKGLYVKQEIKKSKQVWAFMNVELCTLYGTEMVQNDEVSKEISSVNNQCINSWISRIWYKCFVLDIPNVMSE